MYITQHAQRRIDGRLPAPLAAEVTDTLESIMGKVGDVVYICRYLWPPVVADDGSNGTVVLAVTQDGSVETVCYRRGTEGIRESYPNAELIDLMVG